MEEYNLHPYHNHPDSLANSPITPMMIEHLRATKPWVRLISIVMFVSVGLMFLGGLAMMFFSNAPGMRGAGFGAGIGFFYFLMGAFYIAPAIFLHKYASSINDLLKGGGDVAMEMALEAQKSFWKFMGIVTLVMICLYALIFLIGIFGAMSAFRRF